MEMIPSKIIPEKYLRESMQVANDWNVHLENEGQHSSPAFSDYSFVFLV